MLTLQFFLQDTSLSVRIDIGDSVNLCYLTLVEKCPIFFRKLQASDLTLSCVQGTTLKVTGILTFPISFAQFSDIFNIKFYVTPHFVLSYDGLLGNDSLKTLCIDVFPNAIVHTYTCTARHCLAY